MAKSLHDASLMQAKHSSIFENYNTTFPQSLTQKWKAQIEKWNKDHSVKPDPYEEIESRAVFISETNESSILMVL